ncbi:hypothetical protein [Polymorphospora sp. NPDC050346]|uniref:hypothetical protein n=1 Tax=Polymorphospora sp. NPDC050346 TaxID=3155780 RepID=UPI0033E0E371
MQTEYGWFRELYDELMYRPDDADVGQLLRAHPERSAAQLAALAPLRHRQKRHRPAGDELWNQLWELYALSRISDYLLELGCPDGEPTEGSGTTGVRRLDPTNLAVHETFLSGIGFDRFEHGHEFSPFHHEIFAVETDESAVTATLQEVLWPGFRFGDLQFCRAGVRVRAPSWLIDPDVATRSTLHFTFRRGSRTTHDLSHGWGSNSQWRTEFTRFYEDGDGLHLNWDGRTDIGVDAPVIPEGSFDADENHPIDRRREMLLHRCLVRAPLPPDEQHDWYPFEDRLTLRRSTWPLAADAIV